MLTTMGADIHSCVELKNALSQKWELAAQEIFPLDDSARKWYKKDFTSQPFSEQSYALFGFLADVRNYSRCPPIATPRGLPSDWGENEHPEDGDYHSHSWLLLRELLEFDYQQKFLAQREDNYIDSGEILQIWGSYITYQEHLGERYFKTLEILSSLGEPNCVRVVFWFDS